MSDAFVAKIADTDLPSDGAYLDVLDAKDFRTGATISTDPLILANLSGHPVTGVATDGAAQLILRARTNRPGTVTFTLAGADGGATDNPAEDGKLLTREGDSAGDTLAVVAEPLAGAPGEYYAFARYRAPETFPRSSVAADRSAAERRLRLRLQFEPSDGSPPPAQPLDRWLTLARPPVVLIHGLNSDSGTWDAFKEKLQTRIPGLWIDAEVGDYRYNNRAHFSVNDKVPTAAAIRARKAYRNRGLAAIRADVFGHSMGGILSRIAAGADNYRRASNYGEGDFNKLVTVDSPHGGSPWADLIWDGLGTPIGASIEALLKVPSAGYLGAIEDLQTDSAALCTMRARPTDVPAHAIAGNYIPTVDDLADLACVANSALRQPSVGVFCKGWRLLKLAGFETGISTNFPLGGDLVVGLASQWDGFGGDSPRVFTRDHIHMDFADHPWALGTDAVADRAVELLNASPQDGALFGTGFPVSACSQHLAARPRRSVAAAPLKGLTFTAPLDGSVVAPGEVVTVQVQPDPGVVPTDLMLTSLGDVQQRAAPPWEFQLTIPASAAGPFALSAVGKDAAAKFYGAALTLNVISASPLQTLGVAPANVAIADAALPYSLAVTGHYEDGSQRDLTAAATGTTYTSQAPAIVAVDAAGQVTPQTNGTTTITVTHGPVSALVPVVVQMETDLAIQQTASPSPVAPGADLAVAITVTNLGQAMAREVQVESRLPANSVFVSAGGNGWGCIEAGGLVNCSRESLAAGATATIDLVFQTPASCQSIDSHAAVSASTPDGHADNNVSVVTTPCGATTFVLTLTKTGAGRGRVTGPQLDCGETCTQTYPQGTAVTLTANPEPGSVFTHWSGADCAGTDPCTLTLTADRALTADFALSPQEIPNRTRVTGLNGPVGTLQYYRLAVSDGTTDLRLATAGGTGDVDLYVRRDTLPTLAQFDCSSVTPGNAEACAFPAPAAGAWFIGLYARAPYTGVELTARYATATTCPLADDELQLQHTTIATTLSAAACRSVTAGAGVLVAPGGQLTLRAGERIRLAPGVRVAIGGQVRGLIDPGLR